MSNTKITLKPKIPIKKKIVLKKKHLYDEYVLTNKHIICKFKYLVLCFDDPGSDDNPSAGLVNLTKSRLSELFEEQNIKIDSVRINGYFFKVMEELKTWHQQISKIEIDCKNIIDIDSLYEYDKGLDQIK